MTDSKPEYMRSKADAERELAERTEVARITVQVFHALRVLKELECDEGVAAVVLAACGPGPFKYASVVPHEEV